jgi:hypothetical protein
VKEKNIYVNERMKEKGEKDKRGGSNKDMRGMIK